MLRNSKEEMGWSAPQDIQSTTMVNRKGRSTPSARVVVLHTTRSCFRAAALSMHSRTSVGRLELWKATPRLMCKPSCLKYEYLLFIRAVTCLVSEGSGSIAANLSASSEASSRVPALVPQTHSMGSPY